MNIGILVIGKEESVFETPAFVLEASRLLELKGNDIQSVVTILPSCDIKLAAEFCKNGAGAVLIAGDTSAFTAAYAGEYAFSGSEKVFEIDNVIYLLSPDLNPEFITGTAIPALNSKNKTYYTSAVFKTFGIGADGLRSLLSECVRNKNRVAFRFIESADGECEVRIRYSNKTNEADVREIIARTTALIKDYLYSVNGETLPEAVINLLRIHDKKLCVAESFTGGGLIKELVLIPGASAVVKEGIVSYSNESKIRRLNVECQIIEHYGAVSVETAYEMAANILMGNDCDLVVATTGNAGPTAEKAGEVGEFFIAVGSKKGIHIYRETAKGDRTRIIETGIKAALFKLYKKLAENEFTEQIKQQEQTL